MDYGQVLREFSIPLEDFYSFYEHPADSTKFFKVACPSISIAQFTNKLSFSSSYEASDILDAVYDGSAWTYLGSARLTDKYRLKQILNGREEVLVSEVSA